MKFRLIVMNFLEFAIWGAYLTSMGRYLGGAGFGESIGYFYSIQGVVSLFMPALMGIVADRYIQAQKVLSLCHVLAGLFMCGAGLYALTASSVAFAPLFTLYTLSVAFFMPTIALTNSVAFNALKKAGLDTVKDFPPIRVFGTVGFIATMWIVDLVGAMSTPWQFVISGALSLILCAYALSLPACEINNASNDQQSLIDALGLKAFALFKQKKMALFFIFSMLLGMCLQVTNGYANPFLESFSAFPEWADAFGVKHSGILISISQISEAVCILFIPYFLKRFGIKNVMFMAMLAWVLRFGLFGAGNPGTGVWMFVLSCIVYGFAFDFFNISGALYVDQETDSEIRSSAQGLFMMMTNGLGATIGTLVAQVVVNRLVYDRAAFSTAAETWGNWQSSWYIFAGFALVVAVAFWFLFPKTDKQ